MYVCMCVCVCVCVVMYVCMYVRKYGYECIRMYLGVCTYVTYVCIYVCVCIYVYVYMYISIPHVCMLAFLHLYMHERVDTCLHTLRIYVAYVRTHLHIVNFRYSATSTPVKVC